MFQCKHCGDCCKSFGPLHYLPLHPWEVKKLKELADSKNINLVIRPTFCQLDKLSKKVICLGYGMQNEPCPFLINNNCSIYEDRPLICKIFPLADYPLASIKFTPQLDFTTNFMECVNNFGPKELFKDFITDGKINIPREELHKKMKEWYGSNYLYVFQNSFIKKCITDHFIYLKSNNIIDLHKIANKNINNYEVIYIIDFLLYKGIKTKEEINKIYDNFINLKYSLEEL